MEVINTLLRLSSAEYHIVGHHTRHRKNDNLPNDKLAELNVLHNETVARKNADKRYLLMLAEKLCFTTRIYYGGQSFYEE